jgi:hypothetical protein
LLTFDAVVDALGQIAAKETAAKQAAAQTEADEPRALAAPAP